MEQIGNCCAKYSLTPMIAAIKMGQRIFPVSARSSKPLKTTTKPSSTILKKGLQMHRPSRLMLKSRLSEHSSEASGMLGSSCIDWQHFIHNCPLPPTGKIGSPDKPGGLGI